MGRGEGEGEGEGAWGGVWCDWRGHGGGSASLRGGRGGLLMERIWMQEEGVEHENGGGLCMKSGCGAAGRGTGKDFGGNDAVKEAWMVDWSWDGCRRMRMRGGGGRGRGHGGTGAPQCRCTTPARPAAPPTNPQDPRPAAPPPPPHARPPCPPPPHPPPSPPPPPPPPQCADIFFLKADICQLGMDQRKVGGSRRGGLHALVFSLRGEVASVVGGQRRGLKAGEERGGETRGGGSRGAGGILVALRE